MNWLDNEDLARSSIQLASDGRWEDAVAVERTDHEALDRWLAKSGPNIAIESIYCDSSGSLKGFFGFRRIIESSEQRLSIWQGVIGLLGAPHLLNSAPNGIELGVFNQWLSAAPIKLHKNRLDLADVNFGPGWIRDGATAPICREHYWMVSELFWIGEVVSSEANGRHWIDPSLLPM